MTDKQQTTGEPEQATFDPRAPLPSVTASISRGDVFEKLGKASRRGRLPGYRDRAAQSQFDLDAFGQPFDHLLVGSVHEDGAGVRIDFTSSAKPRLPVIFALILIATIWPGLPITDSLIPGEWGWWPTWWWYLPLTILPLPFIVPKIWKRSQTAARSEAHAMIAKVAHETGGAVAPSDAD